MPFTSTLLRKMGGTVGPPGYRITFHTSNVVMAGTSAAVFFELIGENGSSSELRVMSNQGRMQGSGMRRQRSCVLVEPIGENGSSSLWRRGGQGGPGQGLRHQNCCLFSTYRREWFVGSCAIREGCKDQGMQGSVVQGVCGTSAAVSFELYHHRERLSSEVDGWVGRGGTSG